MKKQNKFKVAVKKILPLTLTFAIAISAFAGCTNNEKNPTKPVDPNPGGGEIVTPVEQKETAIVIAKDIVEKAGLQAAYDNAIMGIVEDKYQEVQNITSVDVVFGTNGRLTIVANVKDANSEAKEVTLEYEGDTSGFAGIVSLDKSVANLTAQILAELGIDASDEFVKDSNGYKELVTAVSAKLDEQKAKITALSSIDSESIIEKQEVQPEIEYVSVQSIVDEIWGDVDIDADIKAIAKYLTETRLSNLPFDKLLAVDVEKNELVVYVSTLKNDVKRFYSFSTEVENENINSFFSCVKNKDLIIEEILSHFELNQNIVKDSQDEINLRNDLSTSKASYIETKNDLLGKASGQIMGKGLFTPSILTESQMENLGVESMNEFAYALQSNTRGTGYDYVDGWTMDDVVETYVTSTSAGGISGTTGYNVKIISANGIYEYHLVILNGAGDNAYRKLLIDSADVAVTRGDKLANYSDDAIVYDSEGQRIEENIQNQNASLYSIEVDGN